MSDLFELYPKTEDRPVGGWMTRQMLFRGEHGYDCKLTGDGWICREGCTVEDAPQHSTYSVMIDTFIDVEQSFERRRLRVFWTISRRAHKQRFKSGRCVLPRDELIDSTPWYNGRTRTKWGARRQMRKRLETR